MDKIRLATLEEIKPIEKVSDLTSLTRVLAMGKILAVWRMANEVDPFHFGDATDKQKYQFLYALCNFLTGAGVPEFYFNVHADDQKFQRVLDNLGAERLSSAPEFRYKLAL